MAWFCDKLRVDEVNAPVFFGLYAFPKGLNDEEVARLCAVVEQYPVQDSELKTDYNEKGERIRFVSWLDKQDPGLDWLIERLRTLVQHANTAMHWHFELDGIFEHVRYERIEGSGGDYADGQYDIGKTPVKSARKLTVQIQLSDAAVYEGGDHDIYGVGRAPRQKGAVIITPSFLMNRITPVTKGVRESLTLWVSGTPFR